MAYQELKNPIKSKCMVCKYPIIKDQSNRKYCVDCKKLQEKALKKRWQKEHYVKRYKVRICLLCSTLFNTNVSRKRYCTKACQSKAKKIRVMEEQIIRWQEKVQDLRMGK